MQSLQCTVRFLHIFGLQHNSAHIHHLLLLLCLGSGDRYLHLFSQMNLIPLLVDDDYLVHSLLHLHDGLEQGNGDRLKLGVASRFEAGLDVEPKPD